MSCFTNTDFDPYIINSVRDSESITPTYLKESLLGHNISRDQLEAILTGIRQGGNIKTVKVFSKMFLLRLLFKKGDKKIQLVVSVSSTITIAGNTRKYVPFATDLQFTPTFIGPVEGEGTGGTLETIIATAVRYISAGCSVATKPADYSQLSGYSQYIKFLEIFFRQFGSVCFTYNTTQMGPFNCQHDPMLKFLTCVFSNQHAIDAITAKWDWLNYLPTQGYNLNDISAVPSMTLRAHVVTMLRDNRLRMLEVCRILIDPPLEILGRSVDGPTESMPPSGASSMASSMASSEASSEASSMASGPSDWEKMLEGRSISPTDESKTYVPPSSPSSASTSIEPQIQVPKGGSLINKKYTKKNNHKSQNKNITKSKNRKTTIKNGKFKRMIKKHTTKYNTYKRKVNGGKLRGNKHKKNNKTMRRYRCVRK